MPGARASAFEIWISDRFRISDFGFRILNHIPASRFRLAPTAHPFTPPLHLSTS